MLLRKLVLATLLLRKLVLAGPSSAVIIVRARKTFAQFVGNVRRCS